MKRLLPRTLQARLVFSHLLVSMISIGILSIYAGNQIFNAVRRQVEHHYEDLAFAATNSLEQPLIDLTAGNATPEELKSSLHGILTNYPEVHYTIYSPDGQPIVDSGETLPPAENRNTAPEIWAAIESPVGEGDYIRSTIKGDDRLYLAVRIEHDDTVFGVLRLDIPVQTAMASARRSVGLFILSALIISMGMSGIGFYLARNLAGPLAGLTRAADDLSRGNLEARVESEIDNQELSQLAYAFNHMAAQLQTHVHELRIFVANASHELRTPLTSIKLRVEALRTGAMDDSDVRDKFLAEIESEVDRLSSMVNDMLDLSRIEAGQGAEERRELQLSILINDLWETFRVRAEKAGIELERKITPGLAPVRGNEDQLRRVLTNLLDNAIKYTPCNGRITVVLEPGSEPEFVRIEVQDTGFGIAKSNLPHIFERFYRVEATRPRYGPPQGSGLGLAIARSIIENHQGQIGVNSRLGKGTVFWIELPAANGRLLS